MRRHPGVRRRADGSLHIRPGGALVLCVLVWALCLGVSLEALWTLGPAGIVLVPVPLLVSSAVWALLWAPRVVVRADRIEVRNVLVTHVLPMAVIEDVRLGAMLRFVLSSGPTETRRTVITAWNAPGTGKDRHRDRLAQSDPRTRLDRDPKGGVPRADWSQRLVRDQRASASYAAIESWETWQSSSDAVVTEAAPRARVNAGVLSVLGIGVALVVLQLLI